MYRINTSSGAAISKARLPSAIGRRKIDARCRSGRPFHSVRDTNGVRVLQIRLALNWVL